MTNRELNNEKNLLKESAKGIIDDIMDNYTLYSDEEREIIKRCLNSLTTVNNIVEKYDIKKRKIWFPKLHELLNKALGNEVK